MTSNHYIIYGLIALITMYLMMLKSFNNPMDFLFLTHGEIVLYSAILAVFWPVVLAGYIYVRVRWLVVTLFNAIKHRKAG